LLSRLQALHEYTSSNAWAFVAWALFFVLVLFFEMMVVFCKLVFEDTVDDELEKIREAISQRKARDYMEAVTNPAAQALAFTESLSS
jgi:cobalamin biosynthesis protein CobD/CbiB